MPKERMRIGNQTAKSARPLSRPFDFALEHGFDAFEWFSDGGNSGWNEQQLGEAERRRLRQTALDHDLIFSVHAPIAATPFTPDGLAEILRSIDFGGAVGAGVINLHLGTERRAGAC